MFDEGTLIHLGQAEEFVNIMASMKNSLINIDINIEDMN